MRGAAILVAALAMPVAASAQDVLAERTLPVGTLVSAADLRATGPEGPDRIAELAGLEVRRAIYAGRPVHAAHLGPPTLVHRNEVVTMTYNSGALGLRAEGRALGSGGAGEPLEVMNLDSRMTVRAVVTGLRQVEVRR